MDMRVPQAVLQAYNNNVFNRERLIPGSDTLFQTPPKYSVQSYEKSIEFMFSEQLKASYNKEQHAMWLRWNPVTRPCFNPELLDDLNNYCRFVANTDAQINFDEESLPLEYTVISSDFPKVFNLGGDLNLFMRMIECRDRLGLIQYGKSCIEVLYWNYIAYNLPLTTLSLVEGECLGGGFEAALSSDLIIAERQARFGFPEISFNLFPGMGAYSFLCRRAGQKTTEELLTTGKIYSAEEMLALGVVDAVVDEGKGKEEIVELIKRRQRSRNGLVSLAAVRRRVQKLDFAELLDVVEMWADAALRLTPRDLKLMNRLVTRQSDLCGSRSIH